MSATTEAEPIVAAPDILRLRAEQHPDRIPLYIDGVGDLTFRQWDRRSDTAARLLARAGLGRGDRVGLLFGERDWIDYAVSYLGVLKIGATAVHLGADLPEAELRRRLDQCPVVGVVHGNAVAPPPIDVPHLIPYAALRGRAGRPVRVPLFAEDIADVLWTSGTTGPAKAFTNPHGTLTYRRGPAGLSKLDFSAPVIAPMPMGTPSSAMTVGMMPLNSPAPVVVCRPGDADRVAALIAHHRATTLMATPWVAMRMVAERVHERHDLSSLTTVAVASAPLPAATARALLRMVPGLTITTAYAQGEAVPAVILNRFDPDRPMSVGRPAPGTGLRVADENGEPVPDGTIGEIWLHSAAPKRCYLDPELTAAIRVDGWTRTRDLGRIGPDGDLYLFDRAVDAIRSGEHLISSIEVEGVLYDHPAVREVAVVGAPDPVLGAVPVAFVALSHGAVDPTAVREFAAARLAPHQRPVRVYAVDALPRGVTGKVLKHRLRSAVAERDLTVAQN
ncbi:MAG TPA: class I adenylate-forming enzyme family protein [Micromonosporaceae bacterium]